MVGRASLLALACGLSLAGCTPDGRQSAISDFDQAVKAAAVADPSERAPPLTPILSPRVRLVTWKIPGEDLPSGGPHVFKRPVWATVDGELRDFCQAFVATRHPDGPVLQSRIEQLLGLRPGAGIGRQMIAFEVDAVQVFRPCPDPDIRTTSCRVAFDDTALKATLDKDPYSARFLLEQMLTSYLLTEGYPFTRRGFTEDWAPPVGDRPRFGLSEYVTRPDAPVVIVSVTSSLAGYCQPPAP